MLTRLRTIGAADGALGFLADPVYEPADIRVGEEGLDRVVLAFEGLIVQGGVYVAVTRTAEVYGTVDLLPIERLLVALVLVARSGDEVMAREVDSRPAAELTGSLLCAVPAILSLAHSGRLAPPPTFPVKGPPEGRHGEGAAPVRGYGYFLSRPITSPRPRLLSVNWHGPLSWVLMVRLPWLVSETWLRPKV